MRQLLYLIGEPGIGKSTLMAELTRTLDPVRREGPLAHILWLAHGEPRFAELGARRPNGFSGTDALPMNIQPRAVEWIGQRPYRFIVGEGDRLANDGFFAAAVQAGYNLTVARLHGSVGEERRRHRGSNQNPSWVRGRVTKNNALAERWPVITLLVDGKTPEELATELRRSFDPGAGFGV